MGQALPQQRRARVACVDGERAGTASVQRAGDVLVLPDLWGHLTINVETSVGIAQEFAWT